MSFIEKMKGKRVLVIGDSFLDQYIQGDCNRISPEAPVPVITVNDKKARSVLGGAANVAANVASLGGMPSLLTLMLPSDQGGAGILNLTREQGIGIDFLSDGRPTTRKVRVISQGQQLLRLDYEDAKPIAKVLQTSFGGLYARHIERTDIVIISDYAKGVISEELCQQLIEVARMHKKPVIIDPKPQHFDYYYGCSYVTPNVKEIHEMTNHKYDTPEKAARYFSANNRCGVLLTKGEEGISLVRGGDIIGTWPAQAREVFDVSGAGDTVVAAFSLALTGGATEAEAIEFANKAAGVVVGKHGTSTVTLEEIK